MTKLQYTILLLSVTLCWSTEMIILKNVPSDVPSFATLAMTNGIGSAILGIIFVGHIRKNLHKRDLKYPLLLSAMNILYNSLMLYALRFIDSSAASFILSSVVAIVPVIMFFMGIKIDKRNIVGIAVIVGGIALSSGGDFFGGKLIGYAVMLAVCVIRGFYIIKMNDFAKKMDSSSLAVTTGAMAAVISFLIWFVIQPKTFFALEYSNAFLSSVFTDGYFICGYAVLMNIIAQKYASPSTCSAVYSFEIVFTTIIAAVIPDVLGERNPITLQKAVSCAIIVVGVLISEIDVASIINAKRGKKYE